MKQIAKYFYRGQIEIGSAEKGYRWTNGYSQTGENGGILYPWMTKRQCQHEAKSVNARAVFVETR